MTENEMNAIRWAITAANSHIKTNESFLALHARYECPEEWLKNPKSRGTMDPEWLQRTQNQCKDARQRIQELRAHRAALLDLLAVHNPIGDMIYEGRNEK